MRYFIAFAVTRPGDRPGEHVTNIDSAVIGRLSSIDSEEDVKAIEKDLLDKEPNNDRCVVKLIGFQKLEA
jgi:hypothetical protein